MVAVQHSSWVGKGFGGVGDTAVVISLKLSFPFTWSTGFPRSQEEQANGL